jgi:DNA modification methylase
MAKGNRGIPVDMGERGTFHKDNKLNEMTNKEWMQFTKSWFIHYPKPRTEDEILHPAKFPESLAKQFIQFFTKSGQCVLDPFLGTGSTLVACSENDRNGIGIELSSKYAKIAKKRAKGQKVITGNSLKIDELWKKNKLPKVDYIFTSPPYGPMLNKKVGVIQESRRKAKLDTNYSTNKNDLANASSYNEFISKVVEVFTKTKNILKPNAYLTIVLQNYIDGPQLKTLAWDVAKELSGIYSFKGEKIWLQDNKGLLPYGYRFSFIPNIHHHYCLIFRNDKND